MNPLKKIVSTPSREIILIAAVCASFALYWAKPDTLTVLTLIAALGSLPTCASAVRSVIRRRITIDTFNAVALVISFATREIPSAAFIVLMLSAARILEWHTESRTHSAVEELLKLKPHTALREREGTTEEIPVEDIHEKDVLLLKTGARIPVDGVVVFGSAYANEAPLTGESRLIEKVVGDRVLSSTLIESGVVKMRATKIGKESTIERMVALMREAALHKSHSEKLADTFAGIFLPVVGVIGLIVWLVTNDIRMTAALFLVACADDMAVAIPLALTASLGQAAKRGVIIKGGEYLDTLSRVTTVVLDKTGTLTYGTPTVKTVQLEKGISKEEFWKYVGIAEKFSEHPVGRVAFHEARAIITDIPDPDTFTVRKGSGIHARIGTDDIVVGNERIIADEGLNLNPETKDRIAELARQISDTTFFVFRNAALLGTISVADIPRPKAAESITKLYASGVKRIIMFTGDNEVTAKEIAEELGIKEYRSSMTPEDKLIELEKLLPDGPVAMVGDGINDAPALSRSDVGIAMGSGGTAVTVEAADVVILTDDLSRIAEMVELGRKTTTVVRGDMIIWFATNFVGFFFVFARALGPAGAAFYNFVTDFLPLLNSTRLFRGHRSTVEK